MSPSQWESRTSSQSARNLSLFLCRQADRIDSLWIGVCTTCKWDMHDHKCAVPLYCVCSKCECFWSLLVSERHLHAAFLIKRSTSILLSVQLPSRLSYYDLLRSKRCLAFQNGCSTLSLRSHSSQTLLHAHTLLTLSIHFHTHHTRRPPSPEPPGGSFPRAPRAPSPLSAAADQPSLILDPHKPQAKRHGGQWDRAERMADRR